MADDNSSDDEFSLDFALPVASKGKGKTAPAKPAKKKSGSSISGLDALLSDSKRDAARSEKVKAILDYGDDILARDLGRTDEQKARTDETEAKDKATHKAIMEDTSVKVPGVIQVFELPQGQALPDLRFRVPTPAGELTVLFEALQRSESDPEDLEELLRGVLVPWVRQKLRGKAPPEVCRWLLRLVGGHEVATVVIAAEQALLQLLAENSKVWRLRYEDMVDIWRGCGAVWLAAANSEEEEEEEEEDYDDEEDEQMYAHLKVNLRSALNVVEACFRRGAYEMSPDELGDMVQDLVAASLDKRVVGSCQAEVDRVLMAVVDTAPTGQNEGSRVLSSVVDGLCDPSARALKSRITPLTWALLARNVPFNLASSASSPSSGSVSTVMGGGGVESAAENADKNAVRSGGGGAAVPSSLRHEVCHRLLTERFLSDTSYAGTEASPEGLGRALEALRVLLDDEDGLLEDESQRGYDRQYVVISLASEMAAGSVVVSKTGKPDGEESRKMNLLLDAINKELTNVMQSSVQMSKTLLALMRSKYAPFASLASARQSTLRFGGNTSSGGGARCGDDEEEGKEKEEDKRGNAESQ